MFTRWWRWLKRFFFRPAPTDLTSFQNISAADLLQEAWRTAKTLAMGESVLVEFNQAKQGRIRVVSIRDSDDELTVGSRNIRGDVRAANIIIDPVNYPDRPIPASFVSKAMLEFMVTGKYPPMEFMLTSKSPAMPI